MKVQITKEQLLITDLTQFDAAAIMHSGQVFRYVATTDGFDLWSNNHWSHLQVLADRVVVTGDDLAYWYNYFDCDTDYQVIKQQLTLPRLQPAIAAGGGIRILRAEIVEMIISFIISANNNIKRFTKTLQDLCAQYGMPIPGHGFAFPSLKQLQTLTVADWRRLGVGYRDVHLVKAVQQLSNWDLDALGKMPTAELNKRLQTLAGVGPKVAACVLLFAFQRYEVVPIDTWIKKALAQFTAAEQQVILTHPYAGILQQYIFYYLQHLHGSL